MATRRSVTSFVALVLLWCVVEAQRWDPSKQRYQLPQAPPVQQLPQAPAAGQYTSEPGCYHDVDQNLKIRCGEPGITPSACEAINCCHDGHQCFYGKAVTLQCTKDAQFILVVARDATQPNIDLESISMLGEGQECKHVAANSLFAIYQLPVTACGSVVSEEPGVIVYENRLTASYEVLYGERGFITRDSSFECVVLVTSAKECRYTGVSVESLVVEVKPLENPPLPVAVMGPLVVDLRLGSGVCTTKGCDEAEAAYTSYYEDAQYPVTKVLRERVYVEVRMLDRNDPNIVLQLGRCWATNAPEPHSMPQWDILINGCPNPNDRYLSSLVAVDSGVDFPSHYKRFSFAMFAFVDAVSMIANKEQIYIHCSASVCVPAPGNSCEQQCYRQKRSAEGESSKTTGRKLVTSSKAIVMVSPDQ